MQVIERRQCTILEFFQNYKVRRQNIRTLQLTCLQKREKFSPRWRGFVVRAQRKKTINGEACVVHVFVLTSDLRNLRYKSSNRIARLNLEGSRL